MHSKWLLAVASVALVLAPSSCAAQEESTTRHWDYRDQSDWRREYPQCAGPNMRQSPIDIVTNLTQSRPDLELDFVDYHQLVEFNVTNTGHSVSFRPTLAPGAAPPSVRLSWSKPAGLLYELQEIHFHWGNGLVRGSEHEVNGRQAAAEMHMVHFRRGLSASDIGRVNDSVVVVGVLIESNKLSHAKIDSLVAVASSVNGTEDTRLNSNPRNLINLLPDHRDSFYTYEGSLTTPPCSEVVTWVVMSQPVFMSHNHLEDLTNFEAEENGVRHKIDANVRDVQPLNGRPVFVSFNMSEAVSLDPTQTYRSTIRFRAAFLNFQQQMNRIRGTVTSVMDTIASAPREVYRRIRMSLSYRPGSS